MRLPTATLKRLGFFLEDNLSWAAMLRWWNIVRPSWPALAGAIVTPLLLTTDIGGQITELIYISVSDDNPFEYLRFLSVLIFSLILCVVTIYFTSQYYPRISERTWRDFRRRSLVAFLFGLAPIAFLFSLGLWNWTTGPGQPHLADFKDVANATLQAMTHTQKLHSTGSIEGSGTPASAHPAASLVLTAGALGAAYAMIFFVIRLNIFTYKSPYSEVPEFRIMDIRKAFLLTASMIAGFGLLCLMVPSFASFVGSISIYFIGLSAWVILLCCVEAFLHRRDWPSISLCIVILASVSYGFQMLDSVFGWDFFGNHNAVTTLTTKPHRPRQNLVEHATSWLNDRANDSPSAPAIIVLADGGGIRAAHHTARVLNALDAQSCGAFGRRIYAISGVSGGSVGVATYLAARAADSQKDVGEAAQCDGPHRISWDNSRAIDEELLRDHLAPLIAGVFFLDPVGGLIPAQNRRLSHISFDTPDRAHLFESSLQGQDGLFWSDLSLVGPKARALQQLQSHLRQGFETAVSDAFGKTPPVVMLNTVRSDDGGLDAVSNVSFKKDTATSFEGESAHHNILDQLSCGAAQPTTVSLATAAVLSARVPFITPPAAIDERACGASGAKSPIRRIRYVDGGYLDNSGASTASDAVDALQRVCRDRQPRVCPPILVLNIHARDLIGRHTAPTRSIDILPEFTAPPSVWLKSASVLARAPNENLCRQVDDYNRMLQTEGLWRQPRSPHTSCSKLYSLHSEAGDHPDDATLSWASELNWVSAAIDVGPRGASNYVPLGWLLGKSEQWVRATTDAKSSRQKSVCSQIAARLGSVMDCGAAH